MFLDAILVWTQSRVFNLFLIYYLWLVDKNSFCITREQICYLRPFRAVSPLRNTVRGKGGCYQEERAGNRDKDEQKVTAPQRFPLGLPRGSFTTWFIFDLVGIFHREHSLSVDVPAFLACLEEVGQVSVCCRSKGSQGTAATLLLLKGQSNKFASNKFTLNFCLLKRFWDLSIV